MRLSKVAGLMSLATPIIGLPIHDEQNGEHVLALAQKGAMVQQAPNTKPALVTRHEEEEEENVTEVTEKDNTKHNQKAQQMDTVKKFLKTLQAKFFPGGNTTQHATTNYSSPLIFGFVDNKDTPQGLNLTWIDSNSTLSAPDAKKIEPREKSPHSTPDPNTPKSNSPIAWELSGGRRHPPCPGWPAKQKYNETHWREWTFLNGYEYGLLDPKCIIGNGSSFKKRSWSSFLG